MFLPAKKFERSTDVTPSFRKPPASESSDSRLADQQMPPRTAATRVIDTKSLAATMIDFPVQERLLNAREVASRLGVSERWVRDHTTRRFPKLRGVKLGTLMRYRSADVDEFMEKLSTPRSSMQPRFGG